MVSLRLCVVALLPLAAWSQWVANNTFWVFAGDSTVRFQYLTLAYYLRFGRWSALSDGVNVTSADDVTRYVVGSQRDPRANAPA